MENILLLPSLLPRNHLDINCDLLWLNWFGATANSRLLFSPTVIITLGDTKKTQVVW